jgi:hypothetical protein
MFSSSQPTLKRDEPLQRLQEDTNSKREEKHAIEESTQQLGSLPSICEVLVWLSRLGNLCSLEVFG